MSDTTVDRANALMENLEPEIAERVQALIKEESDLEVDNGLLARERGAARAQWQKRAKANSDRLAELNVEIQSLLPVNPIPPQVVGSG